MSDDIKPRWKVPRRIRANSRALRRNSTDAERMLWSALRDHRLNGFGFRRQSPIGPFVADFICHSAKLVVELDGGQHFSDDGEVADARRTEFIESRGFKVVRYGNLDVLTNIAGVLETIASLLASRAPTPTLPRKRERGRAGSGETSRS